MGRIILIVEGTTVGQAPGLQAVLDAIAANQGAVAIVKDVADGDSTRLIAAYSQTYDIELNGAASIAAVLQAWFDGVVAGSTAHVLAVEKENAANAARAAVQPIVVT